ncbi:mercuric reductase [Hymenobacter sp. H14-R3]|uniref:mercuric reductase n=1 Tax=Hymenobacter sp. H14-R3 TaxID=3046308 RepID=UPI0024BBB70F|nr:mercuric reductase [Hymenobacter sp. H14-R3]MDJ0366872.1 mercuric reductase [Hymenobacter sp. H14-R3]
MPDYSCDALIIGSGQAGNPLAKALADAGRTVILVEEAQLGGSCVNYGCVPTKTILASAERMHQIRTAEAFGIRLGTEAQVDMPAVIARKDALLAKSRRNLARSFDEDHANITVLRGHATFTGPHALRVQETQERASTIKAKQVFINTGTRPSVPDIPGLAEAGFMTTDQLLDIQEVPEHLVIIGGGYIGLEFGQMFRRFGSRVSIIETGPQLLEREDDDVCECLQNALTDEGVELLLNAETRHVSRNDAGQLTITLHVPEGERRLHGSHLLVATGRQPNSDKLNLEATGIEVNEKGFIQVNSKLQTNVKHIFALGDVHGGPQFTHISYDDFRVVRDNLLHRGRRSAKQRPLPYCVFTDPQLGRIGLSETQAKEDGVAYRVSKIAVRKLSRAQHTSQETGFWKVLVGPDDRILGAAILSPEAGDVMTVLQVAMAGRLRYQQLQDMVIAHPVWAEGLNVVWKELEA